jgi:hypothetical protein
MVAANWTWGWFQPNCLAIEAASSPKPEANIGTDPNEIPTAEPATTFQPGNNVNRAMFSLPV